MSRRKTAVERIKNRITSIAKDNGQAQLLGIATVLHAFSILYGAVMAIRARFYQTGIFPTKSLPCRVVSIGNITAGGTGKTPMAIFVAQTIKKLGYRVVVISRGYRGRMEGSTGVVSDGRTVLLGPDDAGDEPYLIATALTDIPVVVGSDRYQAGMLAIERFSPDIIVLDDAFQHLRLKRDLDLVLLDQHAPLGNGHLLPRGRLREPTSALCRAHALVLTRCDAAAGSDHLPPLTFHGPVFHSIHVPVVHSVSTSNGSSSNEMANFSALKDRTAVAFAGLADNDQFFDSLKQGGARLVRQFAFGDHHPYDEKDMQRIFRHAVANGAEILITTAKDWVKVEPIYRWPLPVVTVDVRIGWNNDSPSFFSFLTTALSNVMKQPSKKN
ncbi:LpxK: tetraacyldisaccharide 4-kinase (lipid A 4-kinase) [Desulfosarcina variabilis str. Montpellier]|uniref:tetraacyldisaccharide 4'-kinase n=1 Tax=Desulfosarcina variabilis TaxID=2300 RepID=UPI003AFB1501